MAWIESHQELARHPKTKKIARTLGISLPAAVGHLHFFWWWAMDYAQDGDLSKYDNDDLADACGWEGDSSALTSALIDSGFIDEEDGLFIHDWDDYAGRLIDKRKANTERKRKSRSSHAVVTRDINVSHRATEPNQTIPNHNTPSTRTRDEVSEPTFSEQAFENQHQNQIHTWANEYEVDSISLGALDDLFEFIGKVDLEVIQFALKKGRKRHINYAINTLQGLCREGKTTKESVAIVPEIDETRRTEHETNRGSPGRGSFKTKIRGQPSVSDDELDEIQRQQAEMLEV